MRRFLRELVYLLQMWRARGRECDESELHVGAPDRETMERLREEYGAPPDVKKEQR